MKYQGGKKKHAKEILEIVLRDRKPGQWYVEPFCGGCNVIDMVEGPRIASDANEELIAMYKALQRGWWPPQYVSEEEYNLIKNNPKYPKELRAYVGFGLSFGAKYFGGYARVSKGREHQMALWRAITAQRIKLMGVEFFALPYQNLAIPQRSIIYCDPPYEGTLGYKGTGIFQKESFWNWCRHRRGQGHTIFVSEYNAPKDFTKVWEKKGVQVSIGFNKDVKKATEKLFTLK